MHLLASGCSVIIQAVRLFLQCTAETLMRLCLALIYYFNCLLLCVSLCSLLVVIFVWVFRFSNKYITNVTMYKCKPFKICLNVSFPSEVNSLFVSRTWSSRSPSEKLVVSMLFPFCLFSPGSVRLLLLFFMVAAHKVTKQRRGISQGDMWSGFKLMKFLSDGH